MAVVVVLGVKAMGQTVPAGAVKLKVAMGVKARIHTDIVIFQSLSGRSLTRLAFL